jgi:hypothetical protein
MTTPIGSQGSGFQSGSPGNIFHRLDLGDCVLQERFDCSNPSKPCIDYDIVGVSHKTVEKLLGADRHIPLDPVE